MQKLPSQFNYSEAVNFSIIYAEKKAKDFSCDIIGPNFILYGVFRALNYELYKDHEIIKNILEGPNSRSFITDIDDLKSFMEDNVLTGNLHYEDLLSILRKLFRIEMFFNKNLDGVPSFTEKNFLWFLEKVKKKQEDFRYEEIKLSLLFYQILLKPTYEIEFLFNRLEIDTKELLENLKKFIIEKSPDIPSVASVFDELKENNREKEEEISKALKFYKNAKNTYYQYAQDYFDNKGRDDLIEVFNQQIENLIKANLILEREEMFKELQMSNKLLGNLERLINNRNYLSHFRKSLFYSKKLNLIDEEIFILQILIQEKDNYDVNISLIKEFLKKYNENEDLKKKIQSEIILEFQRYLGYAYYNTGNFRKALKFLNTVLESMSFTILNDDYPVLINKIIEIHQKLNDLTHIGALNEKIGDYTRKIVEHERLMMDTVKNDVMVYLNLILIQHTTTGSVLFVYDRNKSLIKRGTQVNFPKEIDYDNELLSSLFSAMEIFRREDTKIIEKQRWFPFEGQRYYKIVYPEEIGITIFGRIRNRNITRKLVEANLKLIADKFIEIYLKEITAFRMDVQPFRNYVYILKKPILFLNPFNSANWTSLGYEYSQYLEEESLRKALDCFQQAFKLNPDDTDLKKRIDELKK